MIKQYRKKPVVIDALIWTGENEDEMREFLGHKMLNVLEGNRWLVIDTLEGVIYGNPGDFIIRGVQGEFYPCKPDIFDLTYEAV